MNLPAQSQRTINTQAIEIAIRLGVIFVIVMSCFNILTPFISLIMWGAIIAVSIYRPVMKLSEKLGGRKKLTVTMVAIVGIAVILVPVVSLSTSMVNSATTLGHGLSSGDITIPPPSEKVQEWPLVGEKVYSLWLQSSENIVEVAEKNRELLASLGKKVLGIAANVGTGVLQFVVSLIIAAVFLVNADSSNATTRRLANRLAGDNGDHMVSLTTATVRSVAMGVLGIAVIQALLAGIGMALADVPAAGLLAIVILVLAIAQLPPLLVLLPVIFYVFSEQSTGVAVVFMIWSIVVSFSDAVLKPILLGRGVDAPMLVILLGAIGGMIMSGIVGLFVGAVVLALGYKLFQAWLEKADPLAESMGEKAIAGATAHDSGDG